MLQKKQRNIMSRTPVLPIDALLPAIVASLQATPNLVLEAAPGAGKTTRVPPALLSLLSGQILVLEPRRIAARMAARRVAWELGEAVGETIGYQVRFEEAIGPRTQLRFVTEGILTRRLVSDPTLAGVDTVVLDEFHERHVDTDLALALLKRLQRTRPALKLIVMSATLEAAPVAHFLGDCPVLRSEGRAFPLSIRHLPYSPGALEAQVADAVSLLLREGETGDILIFLPGIAEIRRAMRACDSTARAADRLVLPLHGDLTPAEQDLAVSPNARRKLIFSTNVAESSVTVEGVTAVVDSGLARVATHSPWTGLGTLSIGRISKASARQRAGRAGRTGPGRVLRLYPEEDFSQRPDHDTPEMLRSELSGVGLALRAMGVPRFDAIDWLDMPPAAAVEAAESLLNRLGVTKPMAAQLARYPLPPRLARVLVESLQRGVGEAGCGVTALLGSGARHEKTDLLIALDTPPDARTLQQRQQLLRLARPAKNVMRMDSQKREEALLMAVLTGFPDRVARRRAGNGLLLSGGVSAEFTGEPPPYEFMVVVDAEDRKEKPLPLVRMTARIEPEWLIDLFPDRLRETSAVTWNSTAERVEAVESLLYDDLLLQESRGARPEAHAAAALLTAKALEVGIERFVDAEAFANLLARIAFAGLPRPDAAGVLEQLCAGLVSFAELKRAAANFLPLLEANTGAKLLREFAPVSLALKSGRATKVHYEEGKPPWIASRLQDFFGMQETPRIGRERTPVVVHLLAPNHRAVQTTTDLPGFWDRLYPQVRRELMRRYPRHAWPEKP